MAKPLTNFIGGRGKENRVLSPDTSDLALHDAKITEGRINRASRRKNLSASGFGKLFQEHPVQYISMAVPFLLTRFMGIPGDLTDVDGDYAVHPGHQPAMITDHDLVQIGATEIFNDSTDVICASDHGPDLLLKLWEAGNIIAPGMATKSPEIVAGARAMGVNKFELRQAVEGGTSALAWRAAKQVIESGGSPAEACRVILAIADGFYPDGKGNWLHVGWENVGEPAEKMVTQWLTASEAQEFMGKKKLARIFVDKISQGVQGKPWVNQPLPTTPTPTEIVDPDSCITAMDQMMDTAKAQMNVAQPGIAIEEDALRSDMEGKGADYLAEYVKCAGGEKDNLLHANGITTQAANGDYLLPLAQIVSGEEGIRHYLAVFPNESVMQAHVGGENFRGGYVIDLDRAEVVGNGKGYLELQAPTVKFGADGQPVNTGRRITLKVVAGEVELAIRERTVTTRFSQTAITEDLPGFQKAMDKLADAEQELSGDTQTGINTDHFVDVDGFVMNGESNAVNLSDEALRMLNEMGFGVSNFNGGSEYPHIVNWERDGLVRISPTEFLFTPHGELVKPAIIDAQGMLRYRMDDGTFQKIFTQLPSVEGAKWVLVYNLVGSPNPGKAWLVLIEDTGGKSGAPKFIGKLEAIHGGDVDTSIRLKDGRAERLENGQVVEKFEIKIGPEYPAQIQEYIDAHPDAAAAGYELTTTEQYAMISTTAEMTPPTDEQWSQFRFQIGRPFVFNEPTGDGWERLTINGFLSKFSLIQSLDGSQTAVVLEVTTKDINGREIIVKGIRDVTGKSPATFNEFEVNSNMTIEEWLGKFAIGTKIDISGASDRPHKNPFAETIYPAGADYVDLLKKLISGKITAEELQGLEFLLGSVGKR